MSKLGVGFIGSGFVAGFHAKAFQGVRDAEITAICNIREPSAKRLSAEIREYGVGKPTVFTDLFEMLSDKSVNAIWIMTPNFARLETVEAIVEEVNQGRSDIVGVCCEKPLARTYDEAEKMVELIEKAGLLHGYLENQVYAPSVGKAKDTIWRYGAPYSGNPYLIRAAEEHGGPHLQWFWDPKRSGGGVLLDMGCHSIETARFLATDPSKPKTALKPVSIQGNIASLKWTNEPYLSKLKKEFNIDYTESPAEDYALTLIVCV